MHCPFAAISFLHPNFSQRSMSTAMMTPFVSFVNPEYGHSIFTAWGIKFHLVIQHYKKNIKPVFQTATHTDFLSNHLHKPGLLPNNASMVLGIDVVK